MSGPKSYSHFPGKGFDSEAVNAFIEATPAGRRLTKKEEADYIREAQAGDDSAKEALVRASYRLITNEVTNFVQRHRHGQANEETLWLSAYSHAIVKLYDAINRFDLSFGTRFITFAMSWIRLGIRKEIFHDAQRHRPIRNFQDKTEAAYVDVEEALHLEDRSGVKDNKDLIDQLITVVNNGVLDETERFVIKCRYGIDSFEHTNEEIGSVLGLKTTRVSDIESRALRKLFVKLRPAVVDNDGF